MKRPASIIGFEDNILEDGGLVQKRPAAAESVLKRPAADASEASETIKRPASLAAFDDECHNDRSAAEGTVQKRPAGAVSSLKRPAAVIEDTTNEEVHADAAQDEGPNDAQLARVAVNNVRKQQRLIDRLTAQNENLAQKMKDNRSELRKAEREMEGLKEVATKYARKLGAKKAAHLRKKMQGKLNKAKAKGEKAAAAFNSAKKRVNSMRKAVSAVKQKADTAEIAYKRAQKAYDEAKKRCKQLKDQGEEVPDEGEKDLSSPQAYKPPGVRAAKERDALKPQLVRLKAAWEKAAAAASIKLQRVDSLKEKMNHAKQRQEEAEEEASMKKRPAAK